MREIKFRIWDKKYHTFEFNCSPDIFISTDGEVYEKDERNYGMQTYIEYGKTDFYEINQYAGLKDKNGKEIFEGDIVEVNQNSSEKGKWEIYFGLGSYMCKNTDNPIFLEDIVDILFDSEGKNQAEVIGNIYENSELLDK